MLNSERSIVPEHSPGEWTWSVSWCGAEKVGGDVKINTINKLSRPSSRSSSTGGAVLFRVKSDRRLNPQLGSGQPFSLFARKATSRSRVRAPALPLLRTRIFHTCEEVEASSMSLPRPPPKTNPYPPHWLYVGV